MSNSPPPRRALLRAETARVRRRWLSLLERAGARERIGDLRIVVIKPLGRLIGGRGRPIHIGLFVETKSDGIGLVPLGAYTAGTHQIHWDLRVTGKQLASGKYAVFLEIFDARNRPSGVPPSRFQAVLTISKGGRDSVRMFTIKYSEL